MKHLFMRMLLLYINENGKIDDSDWSMAGLDIVAQYEYIYHKY